MEKRVRNYTFTLNNYTTEEVAWLEATNAQTKYIIFGEEIGDETHTPHLQGFVMFYNAKTFTQVKKYFGDRYHLEQSKGTALENIAYCSKDGKIHETGTRPSQGARNDLRVAVEALNSGVPVSTVIFQASSYQAARHIELLSKYLPMPPPKKRIIHWYYGPSGTGKTYAATQIDPSYWISGRNLKWWDGYDGQKVAIIDDFRGDFCTFHELLRILDQYPYRVELKGTSKWISPNTEYIIITSFYSPYKVYENLKPEYLQQLIRRIDLIQVFNAVQEICSKDLHEEEVC